MQTTEPLRIAIFASLILGLACGNASAQETPTLAERFQQNAATIQGNVTRFQWANPMSYLDVQVDEADGTTATWRVQLGSAVDLGLLGWSSDTLRAGDDVEVSGRQPFRFGASQSPESQRVINARSLSRDSGPNLILNELEALPENGGSAASTRQALTPADALLGVWSLLFDTSNLALFLEASPLLTEQGKALVPSRGTRDFAVDIANRWTSLANCIPRPPPQSMFNSSVTLFEARGDDIVIVPDPSFGDIERVVHMNATTHGDSDSDHRQGHSIGRWANDGLVVETVFNDGEYGTIIPGVPFSGTTLVERFELTPDRNHIRHTFSVENPDYLVLPFTGNAGLAFLRPDVETLPRLACDLETAREYFRPQVEQYSQRVEQLDEGEQ